MIDKNYLQEISEKQGIKIERDKLDNFEKYAEFLVKYNENVNLTAITAPKDIALKHFLDSIVPLSLIEIKKGAKVADVGTGAGFPSVPMKIMREDIDLTLIDSLAKRVNFLKQLSELIGQNNTHIHMRAEGAGVDKNLREKFDVVVSRAVAELRVLAEYCLPLVKVGGVMLAMKGPSLQTELTTAEIAITALGGKISDVKEYSLPDGSSRTIVTITKIVNTPKKYPRQRTNISEKPIF